MSYAMIFLLTFLSRYMSSLFLTCTACAKYNKFLLLARCQIAVHQECYGAKNVQDFTSWVCRACEIPDVKRECCLCPVKGMLLNFIS